MYDGDRLRELRGAYVYADYDTGKIWMLRYDRTQKRVTEHRELVDSSLRVVGFAEKPVDPTSDLANAGIYAFHPSVLDEIPEPLPRDIGFDLLPRLVDRARALALDDGYFLDIGTLAALEQARADWEGRTAS